MAVQLQKATQINVGQVVKNAVSAVRSIRSQEQAKRESAFQKAVADGLSYEGQIEFRKQQLEKERASGFIDTEYIGRLEESLANTKRLKRFYDYRLKYKEALSELNAGHVNAVAYRDRLQKLLDSTTDPDLRSEIVGNLAEAETKVTTYRNTVLSNQVKRAQYDGTEKVINNVLKKVKEAKALAEINGNEDEVEQHELTIASLKAQKVQARAEDMVNDIAVSGMLGTINPQSKLQTLNEQIDNADEDSPIVIGDKRYDSERQYWEITRSAYLSGAGSGVFADYFGDLESQIKDKIDGETARLGFVQPSTIQSIDSEIGRLRAQPEMAPFIDRVDNFRSVAVANAVSTLAKTVIDRATYTGDFKAADRTLKGLATSYGVDTSGYQLQLGSILNQQVNASIEAGQGVPEEASLLPSSEFKIPEATAPRVAAPTFETPGMTPSQKPATPTVPSTAPTPAVPAPTSAAPIEPKQKPSEALVKLSIENSPAPAPAAPKKEVARRYTTSDGMRVTKFKDGTQERVKLTK